MIEPADWRPDFLSGVARFLPLALSIGAYGLLWGVLAGQAGLGVPEVLLMSGIVFAGASQFVALDLWATSPLPIGAIVLAVGIVNLRLALMTATLRPLARHLPLPKALTVIFFVADENWALTMGEVAKGRGSIGFLLGGGAVCYATWMVTTLGGRLAGAAVDDPAAYGLDFAFTATFLALLFGMWKGRGDLVPWLVAALVAVVTARLVPGHWHILAGGIIGSLAGAIVESRGRTQHAA